MVRPFEDWELVVVVGSEVANAPSPSSFGRTPCLPLVFEGDGASVIQPIFPVPTLYEAPRSFSFKAVVENLPAHFISHVLVYTALWCVPMEQAC